MAGLFLKNTFRGYFCWVLIESMIFFPFLYFAAVLSKETYMFDFFVLKSPQRHLLHYYKVTALAHLTFNVHFWKFQFYDDTSRTFYGQILLWNGEGYQALEVYHEDWKYSCDQGTTTTEVSMGNFHT